MQKAQREKEKERGEMEGRGDKDFTSSSILSHNGNWHGANIGQANVGTDTYISYPGIKFFR